MTSKGDADPDPVEVDPVAVVFADGGLIPNSRLPLLLYRGVFAAGTPDLGGVIERRYLSNNWARCWRDTVFPFPHYHSTSHEVLGVYRGSAVILLGGMTGRPFEVGPGDVVVIPAGVGHERLSSRDRFGVVGAYPDGLDRDLLHGRPGERPQADRNIAAVPMPTADPIFGREGPLRRHWGAAAKEPGSRPAA